MNRFALRFISVAICLLFVSCAPSPSPSTQYSEASILRKVLENAGKNEAELRSFLDALPSQSASPETAAKASPAASGTRQVPPASLREAGLFLLSTLPPCDAATLSARELLETLNQAFAARADMPWGASVPWPVFLRYVLPHRAAQEPFQPSRSILRKRLTPLVSGMAMSEAALELAAWVAGETDYVATGPRDQGPLTTLILGKGRCEEASILYVCAARSVGIPARIAVTPVWRHADGNHAWVEVYIDGDWHYLDPAVPSGRLDHAWFTRNARLAATVQSYAPGPPESSGNQSAAAGSDTPLRHGPGWTLIDVTARYAQTFPLRIQVLGHTGEPLPNADVTVSIPNHGSLAPVLRLICDSEGWAEARLGRGTVLLTTGRGQLSDFAVVNVGDTSAEACPLAARVGSPEHPEVMPQTAVLDLRRDRLPSGRIPFTYFPLKPEDTPPAVGQSAFVMKIRERKTARKNETAATLLAARSLLKDFPSASGHPAIQRALKESGRNAGTIARAVVLTPEENRTALSALLASMTAKDLAECRPEDLIQTVDYAQTSRKQAETRLHLSYSEDYFQRFVLPLRLSDFEPFEPWRGLLPVLEGSTSAASSTTFPALPEAVARVRELAANLKFTDPHPLGHALTPSQVLHSGSAPLLLDRLNLCTALLRQQGIPARTLHQWDCVQWFDGRRWHTLSPLTVQTPGEISATLAPPAILAVSLDRGRPWPEGRPAFFHDYAVTRIRRTGPGLSHVWVQRLRPDISISIGTIGDKIPALRLPPGSYSLIGISRNSHGEPAAHIVPLQLESGSQSIVTLPIEAP